MVGSGSGSGFERGAAGGSESASWELQEWRRIRMPTRAGEKEEGCVRELVRYWANKTASGLLRNKTNEQNSLKIISF